MSTYALSASRRVARRQMRIFDGILEVKIASD
jgi:hypothetical protein